MDAAGATAMGANIAGQPEVERNDVLTYRFTFGNYNQTDPWTDVRDLTWPEIASLLTQHTVGAKEGSCVVPAVFRGTRRHKAEAEQIDLVVLDSDCGHGLTEIREAVVARGWCAIIHSTHSHLTTTTTASKANWQKALADCPIDAERQFLIDKGYLPGVSRGARIVADDGKHVVFEHQPCPKFRVVLALARPWRASDWPSQDAANAAWKERIETLAAALHLSHDQSCTDTSRLFYLPRRPADGPPPETLVIDGADCNIWALPAAAGSGGGDGLFAATDNSRSHHASEAGREPLEFRDPTTGVPFDLIRWAAEYAGRFEIATALRMRSPNVFAGVHTDSVKHHIRCANEDAHTVPGVDRATFIVNASETENKSFVYHCRHAHCGDCDRLFFLRRMLGQGVLTIADLTDPSFLSGTASDSERGPRPSFDDCCAAAEALSQASTPDTVTSVLRLGAAAELGTIALRRVLDILKRRTALSLGDLKAGLRDIKRENRGASGDVALEVVDAALRRFWQRGEHLIRATDKSFWAFSGTHWGRRTDEQIKSRLLEIVKDIVDPEERDFNAVLNASFNLMIAARAISADVFHFTAEPPPVINCANGELWTDEGGAVELRPHRHDSYLTHVLDVGYDPAATCPEFDRTVEEIFARSSDPTDMRRHFMEFMGYAIQPRRDIACYFMMTGHGNNGKTKLMETIEKLMNARCIFSGRLAEIEANKFLIGSLAGKLILQDDDIDTGTKIPDGLLKKLSERKLLTGELKFKDSFEFVATCLPVLLANNYPLCADLSYGQRRRAHIIPFDRVFSPSEDDRGLFPRIWRHELPGILNRAIEGLQHLRLRGGFREPADCIRAREDWLAHANPLAAFVEERCRIDPAGRIALTTFYDLFTQWAAGAGIRNIPARNTLKANLTSLGYTVRHTKHASSVVDGLEVMGAYPASVNATAA